MSSIYKKGRDGYYYYQAYMYNSKTGKKNKKFFHALGTKDFDEARIKQASYDDLYENEKSENGYKIKSQGSSSFGNLRRFFILLSPIVFIAFYLVDNHYFSVKVDDEISKIKLNLSSTNKSIKGLMGGKDSSKNVNIELDNGNKNHLNNPDHLTLLPNYNLIREEKLSSAYNQIKVSITIDGNPSPEQIKLVCQNIKAKHNRYSNIVISVFENTSIGMSLAKSLNENISIEKQIESWLAFYSYNSVEGEYFDDNPGNYLLVN
jgi:hypothetical protein